jgi:hypothetical protein
MDNTKLYPLRFEPIYQYRLWGGRRLAGLLSAPLPGDESIGEAWVLSDRTDHQSLVANGSLKGQTLGQVIGQFREPLMGKLPASTGATILELQIASTSTTGWRTIGLVLRALTCRRISPRKLPPMRLRQRFKPLVNEGLRTRRTPIRVLRQLPSTSISKRILISCL